jgi:DNA polymerase III subunit delta'
MKTTLSLNSFIGNARAVEIVKRAIEQDRLPHAMIFAGPAGVGKTTLALLLAQYLNCLSPDRTDACGNCSACKKIVAVLESRQLQCQTLKGEGFCGTCPSCITRSKCHPDIRLVQPEQTKTTISIEQVRSLISEIAFQPLEARYRVIILDPADQMRLEAHNSLLKTLEEPPSRTVLILVTTTPYTLLTTIRSRCRLLQFGEIPRHQIEQFLVAENRQTEEARLAAALSGGSLSDALNFQMNEYNEVRNQAFRFIALLLKKEGFIEASALAAQISKDKKFFQLWLETALILLQDVYYAGLAPEHIGQQDLLAQYKKLSGEVPRSSVVSAIHAINRLKSSLQFNVNRQIALESLYLSFDENEKGQI